MNTPTKKITTPIAKAEVEIKDWITGADAEYVDEALMAGVEIKPDIVNKTAQMGKFDTKTLTIETHRLIEKFVVSVNGETKDVLKLVTGLPEDDYELIKDEISQRRSTKKKQLAGQLKQ